MKKVLITGINGFVGKHLARTLHDKGVSVWGIGRKESDVSADIREIVEYYNACDITNPRDVAQLPLGDLDVVINLAGLANVGSSFSNKELYMKVNVEVLRVIGDALISSNPKARLIAVSTGAVYAPHQQMPLTEDSQTIAEGSPYAMSKLVMENAAHSLRRDGLDVVIVRPFNHIGPGQGSGFLVPDIIKKIAAVDKCRPTLRAGNLDTKRDFSDVRDIARAYAEVAFAESLSSDVYNICSGMALSGKDIVKIICKRFDVNFDNLNIEVDYSLIRPTDPLEIYGSNYRIQSDLNWKPLIKLETTIDDIASSLDLAV